MENTTTKTRPVGILKITPEVLVDLLRLPEGTTIENARWDFGYLGGQIEIIVEHPDLPETEYGKPVKEVYAMWYKKDFAGWFERTENGFSPLPEK